MPPTTDNSTEPARDDSDADWARWEQTFRDARPVLPEAAMARIASAIAREADPDSAQTGTRARWRLRRRIIWLVGILIAINAIALGLILSLHKPSAPIQAVHVEDHYPLNVVIGPPLSVPEQPLVPLEENWQWISSRRPWLLPPATNPWIVGQTLRDQAAAAQVMFRNSPDPWHALGLIEIRRVANVVTTLPSTQGPHYAEFKADALWQMFAAPTLDDIRDHAREVIANPAEKEQPFWIEFFRQVSHPYFSLIKPMHLPNVSTPLPSEFPSKAADRARFDLLVEMGESKVQAALDVLSTRSYAPLRRLRALDDGAALNDKAREELGFGYMAASHDLVERLFALRQVGRTSEADDLIERSKNVSYLTNRADLEVLLVRLGPVDGWEKFLRPLMEDEVRFIENPPQVDESGPRPMEELVIEAAGKSLQAGAIVYEGPVKLSAGPWRIICGKLTVTPHTGGHTVTLLGSGNVWVRGVVRIFTATAPEMTFDSASGELKLTGGVRLNEWTGNRDLKSCIIAPTGEVREIR